MRMKEEMENERVKKVNKWQKKVELLEQKYFGSPKAFWDNPRHEAGIDRHIMSQFE